MGDDPEKPSLASGRRNLRRGTIIALVLFAGLLVWSEPTALLTQVPDWITYAGGSAGFFLGSWLVVARTRLPGARTQWFGLLSLPVASIFIGTFCARSLFEIAAFTAVPKVEHAIPVRIQESLTLGRSYGYRLGGVGYPNGREVQIFVTKEVENKIASQRPPPWSLRFDQLTSCIALMAQQGRWGAVRASVPPIWGRPIDELETCPSP